MVSNSILDTGGGISFLNQSTQQNSCCLIAVSVSSSYGLQDVLAGVLLFIGSITIGPVWLIWMVRATIFPRYHQIETQNEILKNISASERATKHRNNTTTSVLDSTGVKPLRRA